MVVESRDITVSSASRERLSTLFCRKDSATYEGAKKIAGGLKIDLLGILSVSGDGSQTEKNYQSFRTSLCHQSDYSYDASYYQKLQITEASKVILDAFTACISRKGLKQYLTTDPTKPTKFVWNIYYDPPGEKGTARVILSTDPKGICTLNGKQVPPAIDTSAAGKRLLCSTPPAKGAVLTINSSLASPTPPAIFVAGLQPQESAPWIQIGPLAAPVDMKAPIAFALPRGMQCKQLSAEGHWFPNCPNKNFVLLCPGLKFSEGQANSEFDTNAYADNCGSCTYTIGCQELTSRRSSPAAKK